MKRNVLIMTLLLIVSCFTMRVVAQENLNALVKKCETIPSVDMDFVRKINPKTKKLETKIIRISINDNQSLIDEFLAARKKDKEKVLQVITKDDPTAKGTWIFYKFNNISYTFSYGEEEGKASIIVKY